MTIVVRLGTPSDVNDAVSVYERSNLARRHGAWPRRAARVAEVADHLGDPASWFLLAHDGGEAVAMALVSPFREGGVGAVVPGVMFIDLIYVVPDRWGQGIGGTLLDAVIPESARRGAFRIHLWTHERDNERAQQLYAGRAFSPSGVSVPDDEGHLTTEWVREAERQPPRR